MILSTFEFQVITVDAFGQPTKRDHRSAQSFIQDLGQEIALEMVLIPGGTFLMGSSETEEAQVRHQESPQHQVTIPTFFIGKYLVTQPQWEAVANLPQVNRRLNPSPARFRGKNRPVEQISWYDAVEFCDRLSAKTGLPYRLPSEAEWEYACRANTTTPFHFGETIAADLANYNSNFQYAFSSKVPGHQQTTPVGSFPPNAFGLYDMHGNVYEWCADTWHNCYEGAPTDGSAWLDFNEHENLSYVRRGGSWLHLPHNCRCAYRTYNDGNAGIQNYLGFRVAFAPYTLE